MTFSKTIVDDTATGVSTEASSLFIKLFPWNASGFLGSDMEWISGKTNIVRLNVLYMVTHQVVANLLLTSKQQFHFGPAWPSQAKTELL